MSGSPAYYLTGGAANTDPDASLGGDISSEVLSATALNNLFDHVSPAEASAGDVEYRVIALKNDGDATLQGLELYISQETTSADTQLDMGYDTTTQTLADESTAPSSVTFSHPLTGARLSLPDIAVGAEIRLYFRRTVNSSAANKVSDTGKFMLVYA